MRIEAIGCEPLQLRRVHLENSRSLDVYRRNGGYEAIKKVLDGMSPDDVINEVKKSA
jgi:NADH-quinone oxidoreductase subunit F